MSDALAAASVPAASPAALPVSVPAVVPCVAEELFPPQPADAAVKTVNLRIQCFPRILLPG